jgi:hypothetical protein
MELIEIVLGAEVSPGKWDYSVRSLHLFGKSRQPLLDSCRQIKSILGDTGRRAGLFRDGREVADVTCLVSVGAATTVKEGNRDSPRFAPYEPFLERKLEAAE